MLLMINEKLKKISMILPILLVTNHADILMYDIINTTVCKYGSYKNRKIKIN